MPTTTPADGGPRAERREWFEEAFDEDYRLVYATRTDDQARAEIELLVRTLPVTPRDRVLDLCCGHGRHLRALAADGIDAVGVDLSRDLLRKARQESPSSQLVRADMRRLPLGPSFDVVLNLFTSFGYFEQPADHHTAAREMARVLRPGGRLCVDLMNGALVVRTLERSSHRRVKHLEVTEERNFDADRRRVEKRVHLRNLQSGLERSYRESVRIFTLEEARELFGEAGVEIERVLGDFGGGSFTPDSPRMVLLGRKT